MRNFKIIAPWTFNFFLKQRELTIKKTQLIKPLLPFSVVFVMAFTSTTAQITLVLQPGPEDGFDTPIGFYTPQNYSIMNFSFMSELLAKALTVGGDCSVARSLLRFDLSAIPVSAVILSANLTLYSVSNVNPPHSGSNSSYIRRVTSSWTNSLVTWNTEPNNTSVDQATLAQSMSSTQDYNVDVTAMVSHMTANPQTNYGFELGLFNESCGKILTFGSSKNSNQAKRPKLVVQYSLLNVAINENKLSQATSIYPNPSSGKIHVRSSEGDLRLELYNLMSGLVLVKEVCEPNQQIDISHLPTGVYIYKTTSFKGQNTAGKIIVVN